MTAGQSMSSMRNWPCPSMAVPQTLCEAWCSDMPKLIDRADARVIVAHRLQRVHQLLGVQLASGPAETLDEELEAT